MFSGHDKRRPKGRGRGEAVAKLLALYKKPKDPAAFDSYYFTTHVPLAKKVPGLRKYDVSKGIVATPGGPSDFHLVATLYFDSAADIRNALGSTEGQVVAGDLGNFADGGVDLLIFDTVEV
jgi:uncharacterized protein (TIGR02118 family)